MGVAHQQHDSQPQFGILIKRVVGPIRYASVLLYLCLCLVALFSQGAFAGDVYSCTLNEHNVHCDFPMHETGNGIRILADRMAGVMGVLNGPRCNVSNFEGTGDVISIDPLIIATVKIFEAYTCTISDTDTTDRRRVAETDYVHYSLDCIKALFKFYARGFDTFMDGRTMHWDTLTERVPWRPITNQPIKSAFGVLCR